MPTFSSGGVDIHYQLAGEGYPLIGSHEFAGDIIRWEPQVHFFSRRYQVITYCHRGYPPSGGPDNPAAYSQDHQVEDLCRRLRHLSIDRAYIGGLLMGGTVTISFAIAHPGMCWALIVASAGAGSYSGDRERLLASWQALSDSEGRSGCNSCARTRWAGPSFTLGWRPP